MTSCGTSNTADGAIGGAVVGGVLGGWDGAVAGGAVGAAGGAIVDYDERSRAEEHYRRMREIDYSRGYKGYTSGPYFHR